MSDFARFASHYRRFVRGLEFICRYCPALLCLWAVRIWGRLASPYRLHAARITGAMQAALGLSDAAVGEAWRRWREGHGEFGLAIFSYRKWTPAMLDDGIVCADLPLLRRAAQTGGLLLTYHSHHHNSLFCQFGFAGARISVLAASEEGSPLYPAIGRYIHLINRGSALHFGGGDYLFTDNLRSLVKDVKAVFDAGGMVASLCDFNGGNTAYPLFGRLLTPPTGAIALALKQQVPIYTAILYGGYGDKPVLRLRELDGHGGEAAVVRQYLDFLGDVLRVAPAAWQGWDWFLDLPAAPPAAATDRCGKDSPAGLSDNTASLEGI